MPSDPIRLALDRRAQPISFTRRLWSSEGGPWRGLRLERHAVGPAGRLQDFAVPEALLGLCLRGVADMQFGTGSHARHAVVRPGRFILLAAGGEQPPIQWSGTRETLYVSIRGEDIDSLLGPELRATGRPGASGLAPQHAVADGQIARLMRNMLDEAAAGAPSGRLYAESLSAALVAYLVRGYARAERPRARVGARLPRAVAARVIEYVQAHLDRNVSLVELAGLSGLSPHHFSLVFRNTFETTPHHYLLQQRVARAKRLVAAGGRSIGEAALESGFASQSHFTRVFQRLCGETPRAWRRSL